MKIISNIPPTWKFHKLGSFIDELESGVSVNSSEEDGDHRYLILKTSCVSAGRFDASESKPVVHSELGRLRCPVRKGSIVISRMNTPDLVGANAYVSAEVAGVYLPDRLWQTVWKENAQIDPRWLAQLLASSAGRTFLKSIASGTSDTMKNIPKEGFLSIEIPTPTLAEQRKIADILTAWDDALEKLDALIAAKERRKQGLMQQLLTGKKRLKGFDGPVRSMRASEIFTNRSERNTEGLPVLSVTQDQGVLLRSDLDRRISHNEDNTHTYKIVQAGDFIISLRSFQGGLEYSTITGAVSPAYHVIYPVIEIDRAFYRHYFKSADFVSRLAIAVIGIRDGKQVSFADFGFIRLPSLTLEQQRKIAAILDTCDNELRLLHAQRAALDQQKRGLMQRLLTGAIRVCTSGNGGNG